MAAARIASAKYLGRPFFLNNHKWTFGYKTLINPLSSGFDKFAFCHELTRVSPRFPRSSNNPCGSASEDNNSTKESQTDLFLCRERRLFVCHLSTSVCSAPQERPFPVFSETRGRLLLRGRSNRSLARSSPEEPEESDNIPEIQHPNWDK